MDSYNEIFANKKRILVVTAHPDDAEINAGGLIARLIADKKAVRIAVTTNGINGSKNTTINNRNDFAKARVKSQKTGAQTLGVSKTEIINLGISDGQVENDLKTIELIAFQIREFRPDIVLTHNPDDTIIHYSDSVYWANHRDHRNTAKSVIDAIYPYSRDTGFFEQHFKQGLKSHYVEEILFFEQYNTINEKFIDISKFTAQKKLALEKHKIANVLTDSDIQVFMTENKKTNKSYERFGYMKIDRLRTV